MTVGRREPQTRVHTPAEIMCTANQAMKSSRSSRLHEDRPLAIGIPELVAMTIRSQTDYSPAARWMMSDLPATVSPPRRIPF